MADWGPGASESWINPSSIDVTPGATAHTKGSWTNASLLTEPAHGFWLLFDWMQAVTTARTVLFDIAVDGVVIVNNLSICPGGYSSGSPTSRTHEQIIFVPVTLPAGQVQVRAQTNVASHGTCAVTISPCKYAERPSSAVCTTYGATIANSRGTALVASNTGGAFGAWVSLTTACERTRELLLHLGHGNTWQTAFADQYHRVEIGVSTDGTNWTPVWSPSFVGGAASSTGLVHPQYLPLALLDIPAGLYIGARLARQSNSASQRTLYATLYGFG